MTNLNMSIAVAEAMGLVCYKGSNRYGGKDDMLWDGNHFSTVKDLPDYPGDLNAMREIENWLEYHCKEWFAPEGRDGGATEAYLYHLKSVVKCGEWALIGATAAQRCEAFLRTVGKWVPE